MTRQKSEQGLPPIEQAEELAENQQDTGPFTGYEQAIEQAIAERKETRIICFPKDAPGATRDFTAGFSSDAEPVYKFEVNINSKPYPFECGQFIDITDHPASDAIWSAFPAYRRS